MLRLLRKCNSFAQHRKSDKLRTFPRREGFTRNKEKISNLICFGPFVILSKPSLPGQGQRRFATVPSSFSYSPDSLMFPSTWAAPSISARS